jgi:hypothetical protein
MTDVQLLLLVSSLVTIREFHAGNSGEAGSNQNQRLD